MEKSKEDLLVLSAQVGNVRAFSYLFRHYQTPLLRLAFKICGDQSLSHDAVQEAWLDCSKTLKRLQDPRAFRSWIYRSVRWRAIDQLRKMPQHDELKDDVAEHTVESEGKTPNSEGFSSELMGMINQLLAIDRQALHLFYLDEMKITEIAIVLEIPNGTVKSRLNRARKILKKQLEQNS